MSTTILIPRKIKMKPKKCWHCHRSVKETIGKSGLCKKCIALAKNNYAITKIDKMSLADAKAIYDKPCGYSKVELHECLNIFNESLQPVECSEIQFLAISDATNRLGPKNEIK